MQRESLVPSVHHLLLRTCADTMALSPAQVAMWGTGHRNWLNLSVAVHYFVCQGVRPIVVLKKLEYEELTPDLSVADADGVSHPLRDYVMLAPSGIEYTRGEEDDVITIKLAQHYRCPFVSNDRFRSWKGTLGASSTMGVWLQMAALIGFHLRFTLTPDMVFLPEPGYPFKLARRFAEAEPPQTPSTRERAGQGGGSSAYTRVIVRRLVAGCNALEDTAKCRIDEDCEISDLYEWAEEEFGVDETGEQELFLYGEVRMCTHIYIHINIHRREQELVLYGEVRAHRLAAYAHTHTRTHTPRRAHIPDHQTK